jgi:hypothetical protein
MFSIVKDLGMDMKNFSRPLLLFAIILLAGCATAPLQRGILDAGLLSTSRPAVYVKAPNIPFLVGGQGRASLYKTGVMGGLPVKIWLAAYGQGSADAPLAIAALAELPSSWYWDSDGRPADCVDEGLELFGHTGYQAATYVVKSRRDPFAPLVAAEEQQSLQWLARRFVARFHFNACKLVLEYREALPPEFSGKSAREIDREYRRLFAARAGEAFQASPVPERRDAFVAGWAQRIRWHYLDHRFLGTASQYDIVFSDR